MGEKDPERLSDFYTYTKAVTGAAVISVIDLSGFLCCSRGPFYSMCFFFSFLCFGVFFSIIPSLLHICPPP